MTRHYEEVDLRELNPVPEVAMRDWAESPGGQRVFAEIEARAADTTEAHPNPKRPLWQRRTVGIPVFVALSASALLFASAIAGDKVITVSAEEALADPAAVERQLADEGIEATIRSVPASDLLVGKWFHLYIGPKVQIDEGTFALLKSYVGQLDYSHPEVEQRCPGGAECDRTASLEIPGSVEGPLTLIVGREPKPGEHYWAHFWGNELAPSGALYCVALEEKTPTEAQVLLNDLGYEVVWVYEHADIPLSEPVATPPEGEITWAWFRDPGVVDVRVAPKSTAEEVRVSEGTPSEAHPRSSVTWDVGC